MGEASRKKAASKALAAITDLQLRHLAKALRSVIGRIHQGYGNDCPLYAALGAQSLQRLGVESATAVAGGAVWRVGPGDNDVISAAEAAMHPGSVGYAFNSDDPSSRRAMFHAWVDCGMEIVDFTTATLRDAAALLDAADGMSTQVDWVPEFLRVSKTACLPLPDVAQSFEVGVFGYERGPKALEREWLGLKMSPDEQRLCTDQVIEWFRFLEDAPEGTELNLLSFAEGKLNSKDTARNAALENGLIPVKVYR